jgi:hypothetical protein
VKGYRFLWLLVSAVGIGAGFTAGAASYFVATNGVDTHPGTEALPWRTIQHAADELMAGDTVSVRGGRYHERVEPYESGSSNAPIVFRAFPGEAAILDGTGVVMTENDGLFELHGVSHIEIRGFQVVNSGGSGILVSYSTNILVSGNTSSNTVQSGVGAWRSANVHIAGNEVILACNDGENECITVDTTAGFSVHHNHVRDGGPGTDGGEGIDIKNGSCNGSVFSNYVHHLNRLGIYIDAWTRHTYNISVHHNIVHDCPAGFTVASEEGGLLENVHVYNNIAYSNSYGLFVAGKWGVAPRNPLSDIYIVNNTFADNRDPVWGGGILIENEFFTNLVVRNNICSQNESFQIAVEGTSIPWSELALEYNLVDGYRGYDPGTETRGSNYVEGAARFMDRATGDFRLRHGSPAIDSGTAGGAPADDFAGRARPVNGTYDIGAHEYDGRVDDSDGDTMTDVWELRYGLDPSDSSDASDRSDSDPHDNGQEFLADTDPTDSNDYFRITAVSNNSPVAVFFSASSNRSYSLLGRPTLMTDNWSLITSNRGAGGADSLTDTNDPSKGPFYRLGVGLP